MLAVWLLVLPLGCSQPDREDTPVDGTPPPVVTVTRTPTPTPEPTITPSPTPIAPRVVIDDQALDDSGVLTAEAVNLPGPGWLVILRQDDGEPGEPIGQTPLAGGLHDEVTVTVDPSLATETLYAQLHSDAGAAGVFEFPGEDDPYRDDPEATFTVDLQVPRPVIDVAEQVIGEDNIATLARVEALEPTWVVIHADDDGQAGAVLGAALVAEGTHENVTIGVDRRYATPLLHVVLHEDDGAAGVLEFPGGDPPLLVNGKPVVASFAARFPPYVLVYDQPLVDGSIVVDRVISEGPGWVAIYSDQEGQPGLIIGFAPLEDGLNEQVRVDLIESAVTPQLYARLHADVSPDDEFNVGQDVIVRFEERMPLPTVFRTDMGALVMVEDQPLVDDSVSVTLVVVPVDAWVAVHATSAEGAPAEMLGRTFVPAGMSRDVVVELDPAPEAAAVILVLYADQGEAGTFDALGVDPLLTSDNRLIRLPFAIEAAGS